MIGLDRWGFFEVEVMKVGRHVFSILLVLGIALIVISEGRAEQKPSLAILPFFVEKKEDPGRGAICPICKGVYRKGEILPSAPVVLKRLLYPKMEALNIFDILPPEKVEEVLSQRRSVEMEENLLSSSIQLGRDLAVDFLLAGVLFRFEERMGSSLGVEKPASISFDLHLIRMRDGKMVWKSKIDETQQPLSENLFKIGGFLRRRASWLKAEELASVGMDEMLKGFPGIRELEE
jgi:TolB-like protein